MPFDPLTIDTFRFVSWDFDEASLTATFRYALDDAVAFSERIVFSGGRVPTDPAARAALDRCLAMLHLVAGVSYYKAAAPPRIAIECDPIDAERAAFLERLYLNGLGEFAYTNRLDLTDRLRFPAETVASGPPAPLALPRRTAVPIGGGKDSLVTLEALRAAAEPIVLFSVGDPEPIRRTSEISGIRRIVVTRALAPELFELNREGALNGHVPVSAVIAFILATAAVLYGFDAAAVSHERSASSANLTWNGIDVNHQYSKGRAFERDMDDIVTNAVLPGFRYFSFLRPMSELAITGVFAGHERYHDAFRSCNTAFRVGPRAPGTTWCGDCPKCRFVFLALAPFLPKERLVGIFGHDLLDDPRQEPGFAALVGVSDHKPFECVGEIEESVAALALLSLSPEWRGDAVVRSLGDRVLPHVDIRSLVARVLTPEGIEELPERLRSALPEPPSPLATEAAALLSGIDEPADPHGVAE